MRFIIGGKVVKQDERYTVTDNTTLKNLIVSQTELNPNKSTTGHSHAGQEEVYLFHQGSGTMEIDDNQFQVEVGRVITIPDGAFHRVHAGKYGCTFTCVFDGIRYDG